MTGRCYYFYISHKSIGTQILFWFSTSLPFFNITDIIQGQSLLRCSPSTLGLFPGRTCRFNLPTLSRVSSYSYGLWEWVHSRRWDFQEVMHAYCKHDLIQNAKFCENVQLPSPPFGAHFKRAGQGERNARVEKMGSGTRGVEIIGFGFFKLRRLRQTSGLKRPARFYKIRL